MKMPFRALVRAVPPAAAIMMAIATLSSCMAPPPASSSAAELGSSRAYAPAAAKLGTGWGEARDSHVKAGSFERAQSRPDGVGALHYNTRTQVASPPGSDTFRGLREMAGGRVSVGIKDQHGRWLRGVERHGRSNVFAEEGERYEIVVKNLTPYRVEVVVSVDGLDVMDGRSASYSKRGHIIGPRGSVTIPGWRTSMGSVAAFRFAAVEDSYAQRKYGESRNVGVIGVAVFTEKTPPMRVFAQPPPPSSGREPNPFPGERWATPPRS